MSEFTASKSSFLKLIQCSKAFVLQKQFPFLRDKIEVNKQLTFNRGHQVGHLARNLFPGGKDVSEKAGNSSEAIEITKQLLAEKCPVIYEATFVHDGVLVMCDILVFDGRNYEAYEVKSSLKISETYLIDACLQYYVLKNCLENLKDFFLVTLNGNYVLGEQLDVKNLFKRKSVKAEAEKNLEFFRGKIAEAKLLLEKGTVPDVMIGKQCFSPYQCDFFGNCWKNTGGEKSVFNFPFIGRDRLFEWNRSGITEIPQLSDEILSGERQKQIRDTFKSNQAMISHDGINALLSKLVYPAAAMDMEVWSPAVPQLRGTKPFQQVPFLFCLYDGTKSEHFMTEHKEDERREFAMAIIEKCEAYKTIVVYDQTLETQVLRQLAVLFPELQQDLKKVEEKFFDVSAPIKNLDYYEASFRNNFSLKAVAEALKLDADFGKIRSGLEAQNYFDNLRVQENPIEKQMLQDDLLQYCGADAKATWALMDFFQKIGK